MHPSNLVEQNDVVSGGGGNFTDGCGCISSDLAVALFRAARPLLARNTEPAGHIPSVFQIRYQGYKGVVVVDSGLDPSTMVVRPSMKKFQTKHFPWIGVCDYSRPLAFGHLNRQFTMLLSGLGVADDVFTDLQQEHFSRVRRMLYDRDAALMRLEWRNRAVELVVGSSWVSGAVQPPLYHLRSLQQQLTIESSRLRILVPESRTLFGVAETPAFCSKTGKRLPGRLRYGECLVRIMVGGNAVSLNGQRVFVSKNPCYLLGDIRVLHAVSSLERPSLHQLERDLVECIVYLIEGDRPHCGEIAGSDLDGDHVSFRCFITVPTATFFSYSLVRSARLILFCIPYFLCGEVFRLLG